MKGMHGTWITVELQTTLLKRRQILQIMCISIHINKIQENKINRTPFLFAFKQIFMNIFVSRNLIGGSSHNLSESHQMLLDVHFESSGFVSFKS